MTLRRPVVLAITLGLGAAGAVAQDNPAPHGNTMAPPGAEGTADAIATITDHMHGTMAVEPTGDVDVDFVRAMIPHHQGAVEMAQVVLKSGSDPDVRELAEAVIAAQEAEIRWMEAWLEERGLTPD